MASQNVFDKTKSFQCSKETDQYENVTQKHQQAIEYLLALREQIPMVSRSSIDNARKELRQEKL